MYEIHLELGEVVNYNKPVRIVEQEITRPAGVVITSKHLMIFEYVPKKMDILHIHKENQYDLVLKEDLKNVKGTYQKEGTLLTIKGRQFLVLEEHLPLPIL